MQAPRCNWVGVCTMGEDTIGEGGEGVWHPQCQRADTMPHSRGGESKLGERGMSQSTSRKCDWFYNRRAEPLTRGEGQLRWRTMVMKWNNWTLLNTIEHYWTLLNTIEHCWTLLNTVEHYWTLLNTIERYWTLLNTIEHYWYRGFRGFKCFRGFRGFIGFRRIRSFRGLRGFMGFIGF